MKHCVFRKQCVCSLCDRVSEYVCGNVCVTLSHQDRILDIVAQQAGVVEGVLGFLNSGVHRPLFNLVLDGSEQFV